GSREGHTLVGARCAACKAIVPILPRRIVPYLPRRLVVAVAVTLVVGGVATACTGQSLAPSTAGPSALAAPSALPAPTTSPYTFDDEFDGSTLGPAWGFHLKCCGITTPDPTLATVAGGMLHLSVSNVGGTWFGTAVDTASSFSQLYGTFSARIQIPKGPGLWPAFWLYASGSSEIDAAEVCANPIGGNRGNDASLLHTTLHWPGDGKQAADTREPDLSQGWHVYSVDWRPDHISWSLDGMPIWTFSDAAEIPARPLPVILDLGLGGWWCGPADASDNGAQMLVDWVRVLP
ncbi:MAG TPA: glycoside hydrolase family 16 protein, partial [Candidatus Binatus sp.]|nr:glycoside hydrolase family 16 protein [Candidatus Binatus sp.]